MSGLLVQNVMANGSGDYTDLVAGISGIIASGLAYQISDLQLNVDNSSYSGTFDITVPYSGVLNILGEGFPSFTVTSQCSVSGVSTLTGEPNITFQRFTVYSNVSGYSFSVASGCGLQFIDVLGVGIKNGVTAQGYVILNRVESCGDGAGTFINGPVSAIETNIKYYNVGINTTSALIKSSILGDNTTGVYISGTLIMTDTLIFGGLVGVSGVNSNLYLNTVTCSSLVPYGTTNCSFYGDRLVSSASSRCVVGTIVSGSYMNNSIAYPANYTGIYITETNVSNSDPKFVNVSNYDYRLLFKQTSGSPAVELVSGNLPSIVTLTIDPKQLQFTDSQGSLPFYEFYPYIYKQGNSLLFTDYSKETEFAEIYSKYDSLYASLNTQASFSLENIPLESAFGLEDVDPYPWEWDYKTFNTSKVESSSYVIPRSVINLDKVLPVYLGVWSSNIRYDQINSNSIKTYIRSDFRGLSYWPTHEGTEVVWAINGVNQSLVKQVAFTGEVIESYPLLCPDIREKNFIVPSGLVYIGVAKDKYKFIVDPRVASYYKVKDLYGDSPDGKFPWIATNLDLSRDLKGIYAYKNNLFITMSEYTSPIHDRSTLPTESGVGRVLMYNGQLNYDNFIKHFASSGSIEPVIFTLASGNICPTDLTVYEDGKLLIADYLASGIFKYKFAYDYAMIQNSYDSETAILLREGYEDVTI